LQCSARNVFLEILSLSEDLNFVKLNSQSVIKCSFLSHQTEQLNLNHDPLRINFSLTLMTYIIAFLTVISHVIPIPFCT